MYNLEFKIYRLFDTLLKVPHTILWIEKLKQNVLIAVQFTCLYIYMYRFILIAVHSLVSGKIHIPMLIL